MKTKQCCGCKKKLPLTQFKQNKAKTDGLQSQCVECQKRYRRQHYLKNRQKYIDKAHGWRNNIQKWWKEYKATFVCKECGESHPACIQFHHTNPSEKDQCVSQLIGSGSMKRILEEIDKCIPLCANCHAKQHWRD